MFLYNSQEIFAFLKGLGSGIWTTLYVSIIGTIVGLIIGIGCGLIRVQSINPYDSWFKKLIKRVSDIIVRCYVTIFRGTPMVLQALLLNNVLIMLLQITPMTSTIISSLITVSINTGAYLTEVIRNSIQSVDKGQMEAAQAIGMNQTKAMTYIIFPQAIKNSFASIGNELIINIKDTSVLQIIGLQDVFTFIKNVASNDYNIIFWYLIVGVIYLILTYGCSKLLTVTEKKLGYPVKEITSSN